MTDPVLALLIFGLAMALLAALLWPDRGILSRVRRSLGVTERVRMEDSLKHLYKCEISSRVCSVESVAGSVGVSRTHAMELLGKLEELELVGASGEGFHLSEQGRDYALHIVRTHRLLERFLADQTGVEPADWHSEAERREHSFSPEDTDTLSASLGHPLYDPHGDPIPTAKGELPPLTGIPLTAMKIREVASIVHLGDEPREVFQALTSVGLAPQMLVKVTDTGPGRVRFEAGGRDLVLPPVVARNITVEPLPDADLVQESRNTLAEVGEGEEVRVLGIHPTLQGPQRRRLLDLGLVPGTVVEAELKSAGGDPVAFRVRGALIALRKEQAQWILVDRGSAREAGG